MSQKRTSPGATGCSTGPSGLQALQSDRDSATSSPARFCQPSPATSLFQSGWGTLDGLHRGPGRESLRSPARPADTYERRRSGRQTGSHVAGGGVGCRVPRLRPCLERTHWGGSFGPRRSAATASSGSPGDCVRQPQSGQSRRPAARQPATASGSWPAGAGYAGRAARWMSATGAPWW